MLVSRTRRTHVPSRLKGPDISSLASWFLLSHPLVFESLRLCRARVYGRAINLSETKSRTRGVKSASRESIKIGSSPSVRRGQIEIPIMEIRDTTRRRAPRYFESFARAHDRNRALLLLRIVIIRRDARWIIISN